MPASHEPQPTERRGKFTRDENDLTYNRIDLINRFKRFFFFY